MWVYSVNSVYNNFLSPYLTGLQLATDIGSGSQSSLETVASDS